MTETKLPFSDTNLQTISLRGIQKMEYKLVKRKVKDLKADPNQPRKKFEQDKIDALAQTIQSQGIINPIEIDSSDVIVTGEMRWRASKKANIEEVDCNLLTNLDDITRFERQTIENLHHNIFTSEERENAIKKLWDSEKYKTQEELANRLGANYATIGNILRAYNIRKEIPDQILAESKSISTRDLVNIAGIKNKGDRLKIIEKLAKREIKPSEVRKVVKTIKEVSKKAPELKKEILKPETKISEEKLKEVKEIAKLPKDVRNEVVKEEISIKQAKEIAEFPKPEERQAIIKQIKQTEKAVFKALDKLSEDLAWRLYSALYDFIDTFLI